MFTQTQTESNFVNTNMERMHPDNDLNQVLVSIKNVEQREVIKKHDVNVRLQARNR
jgi:hypothetical protein